MKKQTKAQQDLERRKYLEDLRRKEAEKAKRQTRLMWEIVGAVLALIVIVATVVVVVQINKNKANQPSTGGSQQALVENPDAIAMDKLDFSTVALENCTDTESVTDYVRINVSYTPADATEKVTGDIVVRLFKEVAPVTVANFQKLVQSDFYTGSSFHRVVDGFMLQGGKSATGARAETIRGEFATNKWQNNLKHVRGVLSMARTNVANSASSEFFIMHADATHLNGDYASFGYVVYGMDTVDAIAKCQVKANAAMDGEVSDPVYDITINEMTFVSVTATA